MEEALNFLKTNSSEDLSDFLEKLDEEDLAKYHHGKVTHYNFADGSRIEVVEDLITIARARK